MNNLYSFDVLKRDDDYAEIEVVFADESHEIFKAHFPDNSLLPGFLQIDIISEILAIKVIEIKKAKFLQAILPKDKVTYFVKIKDKTFNVKVEKENKKCSEFSIVQK
ncbi:MAG: 3-hydroxyacyl-ACP dehydratase [Campylobacteraceae bacterium]|nr:3-hydroxyacyl-ACP dehydratase [Campylobacteraceae bacterium]